MALLNKRKDKEEIFHKGIVRCHLYAFVMKPRDGYLKIKNPIVPAAERPNPAGYRLFSNRTNNSIVAILWALK